MTGNELGDEGMVKLGEALAVNHSLKLLDLESVFPSMKKIDLFSHCLMISVTLLGTSGATALANGLKSNTTLETLIMKSKLSFGHHS